jgi:hypothetical protein
VSGRVFANADAELAAAEQLAAYIRIAARLASAKDAWVYVDGRSAKRQAPDSFGENEGWVE